MVELDVRIGEHIRLACQRAKRIAKWKRQPVCFNFNGVKIKATRKRSVDSMVWEFYLVNSQHLQTYRKFKRYREYLKKREFEVRCSQLLVDSLVKALPQFIEEGLDSVVYFCATLSEYSDDVDVKTDFNAIVSVLEGAGYVNNEHVGRPESDFSDAEVMGRYVVGQAINCMKKGLPPHSIVTEFRKRYLEAKGK